MARVMVKTMTRTHTSEGTTPPQAPVEVPSLQDIITQLTEHFNGAIPEQEIEELAEIISTEFIRLKDLPYGDSHQMSHFAVYTRPKPMLVINAYDSDFERFYRERYPADYSTLNTINYNQMTITVVNAVKRIQLSYVRQR